jgi:hypothetical protein
MGTGIHLTWKDNSDNEDEFEIERKEGDGAFAKIASVAFDISQLHDTGVSAGRSYTYRVRAIASAGKSAYSNEATMAAPASATGGNDAGGGDAGINTVAWDGGPVSYTQHILPLFARSCGSGQIGCHARDAYGASKDDACRGWLSLENAPLGAMFYAGTSAGTSTGCPDRSLYARLTELDAWQMPSGELRRYVKPNDPQNSYLFNKIAGGPYADTSAPMPPGEALPAQDIAMVKKWIESGAPAD